MALIESPKKVVKKGLSVQVPVETLDLLRRYAEFVEADQGYVVNEMLLHVMTKDKDFQKSLSGPVAGDRLRSIA